MDVDLKSDLHRRVWPNMTTRQEQQLYTELASSITGEGCIVDLGTWMGSTTEALARGLTKPVKIHAYDRYIWATWMDRTYPGHYKAGDSFLEEYKERIYPWRDRIEIHPGDLCQQTWTGQPIELLLVDAMKSLELANAIKREFYPALIPGGYLVHQDFFHYYTAWIHPMQYRLREYFEPLYSVKTTYVFKCIKLVPASTDYSLDTFDDDELHAAFNWSRSLATDFYQKIHIEMGRRCWQLHKNIADNKPNAAEEMKQFMLIYNQSI